MKIEILGTGCPKCKKLEETGKKAEVIKITDINEIIEREVMTTPAITIDGKVKAFGRIPDVEEIKKWLK